MYKKYNTLVQFCTNGTVSIEEVLCQCHTDTDLGIILLEVLPDSYNMAYDCPHLTTLRSFLHTQDIIAVVDDSKAMGDENYGFVMRSKDVLEQTTLGIGVEVARSLIKKHDGTVAQQGTRNTYTLRLPLAESPTLLCAGRVETVGKVKDKLSATLY